MSRTPRKSSGGAKPSTRPITQRSRPKSSVCASLHGVAVLYDCHSIRSQIPFLFDGVLPDFNIGTKGGVTCAREIEAATVGHLRERAGLYQRA